MSHRQPQLWFAVFVVFIDALGMSIIIPILPDLLAELTGRPVGETALIGGAMMAVYALNQFLFGPIVGALSDTYGRRPLILLCLLTLAVDYVLMALSWTVWMLFLGRFVAGLAGASYSVATAYIADVSPKEMRSANFGLVGAAFGVGFILGPALGGMVGEWDLRAPFWLAAALSFGGILFGLFILPESLKPENRRPFGLSRSNPFRALGRAFALPGLGLMLMVYLLMNLADFTYPAIWSYWGKETFDWSKSAIGWTLAYYGIGTAIVQGGLIRWIIPRFGEERAIIWGLIASAISFFLFGFASETWMVLAIIPVACLSHIASAALTGLMTRKVSDSEQGELQGVLGSITAVTSVISPLVMTGIFFLATSKTGAVYLPGAPYLLAWAMVVLSFWPLLRSFRGEARTVG